MHRGRLLQVHLVNPSHVSFGVGVITPRWLFVIAAATPRAFGDPVITDETLEPLDFATIKAGDVVGIGIHTGNALRGYEIGQAARKAGAFVVFGGIHATLYPEESHELGGAHAVVKGDGDAIWGQVITDCQLGTSAARLRRRPRRSRHLQARPLGPPARRPLHVGLRPDGARLPQALLVLLGLEDRRPAAAPAQLRRRDRGDRRAPAQGLPFHRPGRRQLLSRHARPTCTRPRGVPTPPGSSSSRRSARSASS